MNIIVLCAAAAAAAIATVLHVSAAAASAGRDEPAERAAGGADAHSAGRHQDTATRAARH